MLNFVAIIQFVSIESSRAVLIFKTHDLSPTFFLFRHWERFFSGD